jgi:hypothetical protein
MFINMLNTCDIDLIELFFRKYSIPRGTTTSKCIDFGLKEVTTITHKIYDLKQEKKENKIKNEGESLTQNVSFDCLNDVINFIILMTNLSPDRYVEMKRSEVITRSDSFKTEINVYFHVHGTRISHWTPIEVGKFLFSLKDRHVMSREELVEEFQFSMPRMKTFVPLHVEGKFTLNIDNSRQDLRISNITSDAVLLSH